MSEIESVLKETRSFPPSAAFRAKARIADREKIPATAKGGRARNPVYLSMDTVLTVLIYNAMRDQGVRKSELAKRLRVHGPQVDRLLNVRHSSKVGQIERALDALGIRLSFDVVERPRRTRSPKTIANASRSERAA